MKNKILNCFHISFRSISNVLSAGEKKVIPWVLNQLKDKELLEIGAKLTFYYFAIFLLLFGWKLPTLLLSDLNVIGDFLAGVFGPIAFGWLIIGYLMQNTELKNSRKTLETQIDEFKESVRISRESLNQNINNQLKLEKNRKIKIQPSFEISEINIKEKEFFSIHFRVKNHKGTAYRVGIKSLENINISSRSPKSLSKEDAPMEFPVFCKIPSDHLINGGENEIFINFHITCLDEDSNEVKYLSKIYAYQWINDETIYSYHIGPPIYEH